MIRAGWRGGLIGGGAIVVALASGGCGSSSTKTAATTPTTATTTSTGSGTTASGSGSATTAYGSTSPGSTSPGSTAPGSTAPGSTAPGSTAPGSGSGTTTVTITDTEFHESFSTLTFHPGAYTFVAVNKGKLAHALTVQGQGIDVSTPPIDPGHSASINVTLKSGSYDLFCPVPGHKALGMNHEITVGTGSSGGPSPATTASAY